MADYAGCMDLLGRVVFGLLVLFAGLAHALHLADGNRASWRALDTVLVIVAIALAAWLMFSGDRVPVAAPAAAIGSLVIGAIAMIGL